MDVDLNKKCCVSCLGFLHWPKEQADTLVSHNKGTMCKFPSAKGRMHMILCRGEGGGCQNIFCGFFIIIFAVRTDCFFSLLFWAYISAKALFIWYLETMILENDIFYI